MRETLQKKHHIRKIMNSQEKVWKFKPTSCEDIPHTKAMPLQEQRNVRNTRGNAATGEGFSCKCRDW